MRVFVVDSGTILTVRHDGTLLDTINIQIIIINNPLFICYVIAFQILGLLITYTVTIFQFSSPGDAVSSANVTTSI